MRTHLTRRHTPRNSFDAAILISLLLCLVFTGTLAAQPRSGRVPGDTLHLVFTGDIMGHDSQIASALKTGNGSYDYLSCFQPIAPYIRRADIAVGNLEVTLAGAPYKGYPAFSSPDALARALRETGFDVLVNANNHALDRGKKGLERTLAVLDTLSFIRAGSYRDTTERRLHYPLILEKNGIRIALLNYTYGTNGIPVTPPNMVNYIDTAQIRRDLARAATARPDYTIALMHWGSEYQRKENARQRALARLLFEHETDAIIGSHPHVVQPVTLNGDGTLAVWSMGNFISNQRKRYTDGGIAFEMTLVRDGDEVNLLDYAYLPVWVYKRATGNGPAFRVVPAAMDSAVTEMMEMTASDVRAMHLFLSDTRENLPGVREADWKRVMNQAVNPDD